MAPPCFPCFPSAQQLECPRFPASAGLFDKYPLHVALHCSHRVFVDPTFYLAVVYVMTARLRCPQARSLADLTSPARTFHLYDHFFPSPQASGLFGLIFPWLISRSRRNRNHDAPVDKNPPFWGELILWTDLKPAIIRAIDRRSVPNFFLTPQFEVT